MTLSIAMVGLRFGVHVLRGILADDDYARAVRPVLLCDRDAALLAERSREFDLPGESDYDAVLARPDIDAVALFTPPRGRAELVRRAVRAGKHVMTTKPFERDAAAAEAVLAEARAAGRIVHMNSPFRLAPPAVERMLAWQRDFDLGAPVNARWETWASYHENADGTWLDSAEDCPVAPIFRIGIYGINELVRLFGPVGRVHAVGGRLRTGRPTDDNGALVMGLRNGAVGVVFASFCIDENPPYRNLLTVRFERGTVAREMSFGADREPDGIRLSLTANHVERVETFDGRANGGEYQWDGFADAARDPRAADDAEYHRTVVDGIRVIEAMTRP